ncbi:MAG: glutamate--tRNA ligase family protein [Clostridia bacterium]|nr:glutamate--tRNA ligase family protein [Clostridia bacterium]
MKNFHSNQPDGYRIAPSPTGYVHLGTVAMALVNSYLARQNHGRFYLRIEDTDSKRYVSDAVDKMLETFSYFGIDFTERYVQSERATIYQQYAEDLVKQGKAYYCFCTENDLNQMRETQIKNQEPTGYYGKYAKCRNLSKEEVARRVQAGESYVIRANFGYQDWGERITFVDAARGEISLPPQVNDPIILKSNGLPPYNFAHVIDDTLMGTALVVRGEEWLISTAEHMQLCDLLGFPRLQYLHMPTINIEDNGKKRKLSKRKDPQALVMNLVDAGYPRDAVFEYLLTIYNSDFEIWRMANSKASLTDFQFSIQKIGTNNPLFDLPKLNDIAKNVWARYSHEEIVAAFNSWNWQNLPNITPVIKDRIEKMLGVERGGERPRKDLVKFEDIPDLYSYLWNDITVDAGSLDGSLLKSYAEIYDANDDKDTWWQKIKNMAPDKPTLRNLAAQIRLAVTGKTNTPDLWAICQILGNDLVKARLTRW